MTQLEQLSPTDQRDISYSTMSCSPIKPGVNEEEGGGELAPNIQCIKKGLPVGID